MNEETRDNDSSDEVVDGRTLDVQALRRRLKDLDGRVYGVEFDRLPPGERMRRDAQRDLQKCGFTEQQAAGILFAVTSVLSAEAAEQSHERMNSRRWQDDEDEPDVHDSPPQPQPQGAWQHPTFSELIPLIAPLLQDLLPTLLPHLRPKEPAPPRPWWQQQLRKLVGV